MTLDILFTYLTMDERNEGRGSKAPLALLGILIRKKKIYIYMNVKKPPFLKPVAFKFDANPEFTFLFHVTHPVSHAEPSRSSP